MTFSRKLIFVPIANIYPQLKAISPRTLILTSPPILFTLNITKYAAPLIRTLLLGSMLFACIIYLVTIFIIK